MFTPNQVTAIVDTREQLPWTLEPLQTQRGTLCTGDYSVEGLEDFVRLERKASVQELCAMVGRERKRWERELKRLQAFAVSHVVCEFSLEDTKRKTWRGRITPEQLRGSVTGWMASGVSFLFAGDRTNADEVARRILFHAARRAKRGHF